MTETQHTTEVHKTVTEADGTQLEQRSVRDDVTTSGLVVLQRLVWFIVGLVNAFIALRFLFLLFGANRDVGFSDFIYTVSSPLVAPFTGIFGEPIYGSFVFEWSSVLAIIIYTLIGWGIVRLITLARPQEEI